VLRKARRWPACRTSSLQFAFAHFSRKIHPSPTRSVTGRVFCRSFTTNITYRFFSFLYDVYLWFGHLYRNLLDIAVLLLCIWEVPASDLRPETGFPSWGFYRFSSVHGIVGIVNYLKIRSLPRSLPSTSFPVRYSLTVLLFRPIACSLVCGQRH
jgi:hypothetical protein